MKKAQRNIRFLCPALIITLAASLLQPICSYADVAETKDTTATVSFEAGELKLTSVPYLDFGSQPIAGTTQVYPADSIDNNIQICDLRGSHAGWELTASLSSFRLNDVDSGTETLQGAYITVTNQQLSCDNPNLTRPEAEAEVILTSGSDSVCILTAATGCGMGVWNDGWNNENTNLTILPGTAETGTSYAVIDWSLQDTP